MKRYFLMILLLCTLLLTGCRQQSSFTGELWIVTEQTTWDRMNGQTEVLIEAFEKSHDGVTIRLDILPTESLERSVYLQQLRTEILQGGGPDGYLLPTDNTRILDEPIQYTYVEVEPLFTDAELAMRNGLFYDITQLYDADADLGKDDLNQTIMDAGMVGGKRYILPLRYDIPVIYAERDSLEAAGLDGGLLQSDIGTIMEALLESGDPVLAGGILYDDFSAFSDFIDYSSGNAILQEEILTNYLQTYRALQDLIVQPYLDGEHLSDAQIQALAAEDTVLLEKLDMLEFIFGKYGQPDPEKVLSELDKLYLHGKETQDDVQSIYTEYYPLSIGSMADSFSHIAVAICQERELIMAPLRSISGDVVATVTYYAAVGSGCREPGLTYEFLRQFLLEESQWEVNRPERKHTEYIKSMAANASNDLQYPGLIGNGWPVRSHDCVETLWEVRRKQTYIRDLDPSHTDGDRLRMRKIGLRQLEESQIPVADFAIDQVRFNTGLSDELENALATNASPAEIAQQLCWNLRWHVSEG